MQAFVGMGTCPGIGVRRGTHPLRPLVRVVVSVSVPLVVAVAVAVLAGLSARLKVQPKYGKGSRSSTSHHHRPAACLRVSQNWCPPPASGSTHNPQASPPCLPPTLTPHRTHPSLRLQVKRGVVVLQSWAKQRPPGHLLRFG